MERDYRREYEENQRKLDALTHSFKENGTTHVYDSLLNTIITIGKNNERAYETTILGKEGSVSDFQIKTIPVPEKDEDFEKLVKAQEMTIDALQERESVSASRGFVFKDRKNFITEEIPGMGLGKILGQGGMGAVYKGMVDFSKMTIFGLGLVRAGQEAWEIVQEKNLGERTLAELPRIREERFLEAYKKKKKKDLLIDEIFTFYEKNGLGHLARFTPIDVVYKLIQKKFKSDRDMIRRFEREQNLAGYVNEAMTHTIFAGKPNLQQGEPPFLCMEYLPNIMNFKEVKKLPPQVKVGIAMKGALALWSLKLMGGFHRDFKPDNFPIVNDKENDRLYPKLLDFGLLGIDNKPSEAFHTVPGQSFFSPLFAAPEQAKTYFETKVSVPVNYKADVFSLGAYLYELMTQRDIHHNIPEIQRSSQGVARALYENIYLPSPSNLESKNLEGLTQDQCHNIDLSITAALQRDLNNRYAHCGDMYNDLTHIIAGQPAVNAKRICENMGYANFMAGAYDTSGITVVEVRNEEPKKRKTGILKRTLRNLGLK
jgi:serine/threonine protein kinase